MSTQWYYKRMGEVVGPLSAEELKSHAREGRVQPETHVRSAASANWHFAKNVKGLIPVVVVGELPPKKIRISKGAPVRPRAKNQPAEQIVETIHRDEVECNATSPETANAQPTPQNKFPISIPIATIWRVVVPAIGVFIAFVSVYYYLSPKNRFHRKMSSFANSLNEGSPAYYNTLTVKDYYDINYVIESANGESNVPYTAHVTGKLKPGDREQQEKKGTNSQSRLPVGFEIRYHYRRNGLFGAWSLDRHNTVIQLGNLDIGTELGRDPLTLRNAELNWVACMSYKDNAEWDQRSRSRKWAWEHWRHIGD